MISIGIPCHTHVPVHGVHYIHVGITLAMNKPGYNNTPIKKYVIILINRTQAFLVSENIHVHVYLEVQMYKI